MNPVDFLEETVRENLAAFGYILLDTQVKDHLVMARYVTPDGVTKAITAISPMELVLWSTTVPHKASCVCVKCKPIIRGESETVGKRPRRTESRPAKHDIRPWEHPPMESALARKIKSLRWRLTGKLAS